MNDSTIVTPTSRRRNRVGRSTPAGYSGREDARPGRSCRSGTSTSIPSWRYGRAPGGCGGLGRVSGGDDGVGGRPELGRLPEEALERVTPARARGGARRRQQAARRPAQPGAGVGVRPRGGRAGGPAPPAGRTGGGTAGGSAGRVGAAHAAGAPGDQPRVVL